MVEKVYLTSLPWIRQQAATWPGLETADRGLQDMIKPLVDAMAACAAMIEGVPVPKVAQNATVKVAPGERDSIVDAGRSFGRFEQLLAAVRELQVVVLGSES